MGRVVLRPHAESGLRKIWLDIAVDNERAADRLYWRIMNKISLAADQPLMGSPRPELSPNARLLVEGRYVILYEPMNDGIDVISIVPGMRDPENWL
jgi:plasmid stabilization system protein ParE